MPGPTFTARLQQLSQMKVQVLEPEPLQVEEPVFYRYSYGLSFGYGPTLAIQGNGQYYGALIQAWSYDSRLLLDSEARLRTILEGHIKNWLKKEFGWSGVDLEFDKNDRWVPLNDGAGLQESQERDSFDKRIKWQIENPDGRAVDSGEDAL